MTNNALASLRILKVEFREFCVNYLSLSQIEGIFSNAGLTLGEETSSTGTRRGLVEEFYSATDWQKTENVHKLFRIIEYILQLHYISDEIKDCLRSICTDSGFGVDNNKIKYEDTILGEDLFSYQFPAGLPFGVLKPDFSISAEKGGQILKYELQDGLGLIRGKVYPNFSFKILEASYGLNSSTNKVLKKALIDMNQSDYEKKFFVEYAKRFDMANQNLPVLIPQAWIQWHSQAKKNLRSTSSLHMDDLYRVDFVVFWNNKRYVILVDDVSHYAVKKGSDWHANQEAYSKRLKEDRKLRKENWHVFRVSNWELRDNDKVQSILNDLRDFIAF
jgi:hypothetical protein